MKRIYRPLGAIWAPMPLHLLFSVFLLSCAGATISVGVGTLPKLSRCCFNELLEDSQYDSTDFSHHSVHAEPNFPLLLRNASSDTAGKKGHERTTHPQMGWSGRVQHSHHPAATTQNEGNTRDNSCVWFRVKNKQSRKPNAP